MVVKMANREAPSEAVWFETLLFVYASFCRQLVVEILEYLPYVEYERPI